MEDYAPLALMDAPLVSKQANAYPVYNHITSTLIIVYHVQQIAYSVWTVLHVQYVQLEL